MNFEQAAAQVGMSAAALKKTIKRVPSARSYLSRFSKQFCLEKLKLLGGLAEVTTKLMDAAERELDDPANPGEFKVTQAKEYETQVLLSTIKLNVEIAKALPDAPAQNAGATASREERIRWHFEQLIQEGRAEDAAQRIAERAVEIEFEGQTLLLP